MSVDLNVWSNHTLKFSSFAEGLEMFELKTGKRLVREAFETNEAAGETDELPKIQYFTNFETLKHNFKRFNQIKILTNFTYCREIDLYAKTVNFKPRGFYTRYTRWKKLASGNIESHDGEDAKTMSRFRANWELFRYFSIELTKNLGGNRIIYIDDNFQPQEDKFREGRSLECGFGLMREISEPYELELLELCPSEFEEKHAWFFEELD